MTISKDIEELLNEICFMPVPYETRVIMCAAVVREAKEDNCNVEYNERRKIFTITDSCCRCGQTTDISNILKQGLMPAT